MASCMVGPNFSTPQSKIQPHWRKYAGISDRPNLLAENSWWKQFNDSTLNSLVETAYRNNPNLQAAGVRILGARAQLNSSIGNLFPQRQDVILSGRGNYTNNPDDSQSYYGFTDNYLVGQALLSVSWEIDFWGKYRRQIQSDRSGYLATIAAYDSVLVTLIADVANTYVNIRTLQDRLEVTRANVTQQQKSLNVSESRFKAGRVGMLDVDQAKAQLARTQAQLPALEDAEQRATNALAVLLGETPAETERRVSKPGRIPVPPATLAAGVPVDLLRRRPDVRQAGLEAASLSSKIGVEFAKLLPSFSLNGTFGYAGGSESVSLSNVFNWQQSLANSAGSLVVPIFNYGRLVNNVRVSDAAFQEAIFKYQGVVLNAQREVQDGLSAFVQGKRRIDFLETAVAAAQRSAKTANVQYDLGTADYTRVLTAEQQMLNAEDDLAQTRGQVVTALISVYRALGGGWDLRREAGVVSAATRAEMEGRTNWGNLLERSKHIPRQAEPAATPVP
jgi:NodT family efflux transporter outer membrane factor (OMF) lipoprotein